MSLVHQESLVNSGQSFSKYGPITSNGTIICCATTCLVLSQTPDLLKQNLQDDDPGICILTSHPGGFYLQHT